MKKTYSLLVFLLSPLLGITEGNAQVTVSDFKVDNATSVNAYSAVSATRKATFTVKLSRSSSTPAPYSIPAVYLVGGFASEQTTNTYVASQSAWTFDSNGQFVSTYSGTFDLAYSSVANKYHTALQVLLPDNGGTTRSNIVSITEVFPYEYSTKPPVTITNFKVNGSASYVDVSTQAKTVTYSMTLAKDPGYAEDFNVVIQATTSMGGRPDKTVISVGAYNSNSWTLTGTKRTYNFSFTGSLSTNDLTVDDRFLIAQAGASGSGTLLAEATTYIPINRVAAPCRSDVYVQNKGALTGTTTSGKDLYASGTNTVRNGTTAAFIAQNSIALQAGFSVEPGATFSAYTDVNACSARLAADTTGGANMRSTASLVVLTNDTSAKPVAGASEEVSNLKLVAFPNPAQNKLTISLPQLGNEARQVSIYNALGAQVQRVLLSATQQEIDVQNLATGIYYLQVSQQGKTQKTSFTVAR